MNPRSILAQRSIGYFHGVFRGCFRLMLHQRLTTTPRNKINCLFTFLRASENVHHFSLRFRWEISWEKWKMRAGGIWRPFHSSCIGTSTSRKSSVPCTASVTSLLARWKGRVRRAHATEPDCAHDSALEYGVKCTISH